MTITAYYDKLAAALVGTRGDVYRAATALNVEWRQGDALTLYALTGLRMCSNCKVWTRHEVCNFHGAA